MKFVIIGRTATGKTMLAKGLAQNGLTLLKTRTTRPRRGPDDDGYVFLTAQEAAAIPQDEKLLFNAIGPHEYFTTLEDLKAADICILDPTGYRDLLSILPEESVHLIHTTCADMNAQKAAALARAADPVAEEAVFNQRQMDENDLFSKFEQDLASKTTFGQNTLILHRMENDFKPETMLDAIGFYLGYWKLFRNMSVICRNCLKLGIIKSVNADGGHVDVTYKGDGSGAPFRTETVPLEVFVDITLSSPENFTSLVQTYLCQDVGLTDLPDPEGDAVVPETPEEAVGTFSVEGDDSTSDQVDVVLEDDPQ